MLSNAKIVPEAVTRPAVSGRLGQGGEAGYQHPQCGVHLGRREQLPIFMEEKQIGLIRPMSF